MQLTEGRKKKSKDLLFDLQTSSHNRLIQVRTELVVHVYLDLYQFLL